MFSLWCMNKRMEFYLRYPGLNSPRKPTRSYLQLSDYDPLWPANGHIHIRELIESGSRANEFNGFGSAFRAGESLFRTEKSKSWNSRSGDSVSFGADFISRPCSSMSTSPRL